jgi:sugar phosphate isomerase/epimerase
VRLASTDISWPGLPPEFVLDLIRELDLDGVSLGFVGGYTARDPVAAAADPERAGDAVRRELTQAGLELADMLFIPNGDLSTMAANHPDAAERARGDELFAGFARFAVAAGSPGVTVLPGLVFGGEPWSEAVERAVDGMRRRLEVAGEAGLGLSFEPHVVSTTPFVGSVADTPERAGALLERVAGLQVTLDYGHFTVQGIPDREVEPLLDHARHVHARGAAPGLVQTRFVDSVTDYGRVLDCLEERSYGGWIEIEYVHDGRPGCSNCDNVQEVQRIRDFVRARQQPPTPRRFCSRIYR